MGGESNCIQSGSKMELHVSMKIIAFSTIHTPNQQSADAIQLDLIAWRIWMGLTLPDDPYCFLVDGECGAKFNRLPIDCIQTGVAHTKPYHCRDWSYAVAAYQAGFYHALQKPFDLVAFLAADAILGVDLHEVCHEFMARPEVLCGPAWFDKVETHFMLMKRQAVIDHLYSLPFIALPKFPERNAMYYEEALALLFVDRWWNPWPACPTIRQEHGTPEIYRGSEDEIMRWPMLAKYSPTTGARYKAANPIQGARP